MITKISPIFCIGAIVNCRLDIKKNDLKIDKSPDARTYQLNTIFSMSVFENYAYPKMFILNGIQILNVVEIWN